MAACFCCLPGVVAGQTPGPHATVAPCVTCHRAESLSQPATSMGHALEAVAACDILRQHPNLTFREGAYSYRIVRQGDRSIYTVTDGKKTLTTPIAWAFGLGAAGQTYAYQWNGEWYESRVSFYKKLDGLDLTMGAQNHVPATVEEAAGRVMAGVEAADCFGCHATNAVEESRRLTVDRLVAGVQCARCHGDVARHAAAVKAGDVKGATLRRLGALSTEELSDFCGQCHRTWATIALNGPRDINNVRFQPYRLTNSRCYDTADPRIGCVACHDPHREVEQGAAAYDAKCLACHAQSASGSASTGDGSARVAHACPKASSGCVTCHMPRYEIPGSHNLFTDHEIRVVKPGTPYPG